MSEDTPNVPARPVLPSEASQSLTIREFEQRQFAFEQRINDRIRSERDLVEARSKALEILLEARSDAIEKAHLLQAAEYSRRLEELNHAHETNKENWANSMPRDLFAQWEKDYDKWRDGAQQQLTTLAQMPEPPRLSGLLELPIKLHELSQRVVEMDKVLQQSAGAISLARFLGFAGLLALVLFVIRVITGKP